MSKFIKGFYKGYPGQAMIAGEYYNHPLPHNRDCLVFLPDYKPEYTIDISRKEFKKIKEL